MSSQDFSILKIPDAVDETVPEGVYVLNEFFEDEAIDLLITLFKEGPRNQAFLSVVMEQCQEIEQAFWDQIGAWDVDTAVGWQLEILGLTVGQKREGRDDENLRAAIKVRILVNASDGQCEQLLTIARLMAPEGCKVTLTEDFPATVLINFSTLGPLSISNVYGLLHEAKGAGVRLEVTSDDGAVGAVDGDPEGGEVGAVDGTPEGFIISGGT